MRGRQRRVEILHEPALRARQRFRLPAQHDVVAVEHQQPVIADRTGDGELGRGQVVEGGDAVLAEMVGADVRSEEHTSELQSLMRISYAVFFLKHKKATRITSN